MYAKDERVIRKPELFDKVGLSDATIWRLEQEGRFPRRIRLGGNSCGWLSSEVHDWIEQKAAERPSTEKAGRAVVLRERKR